MSNAGEARCLLRAHRYGALSTISKKLEGYPFGSITPYLTDHDGCLVLLISALAEHSKNIRHDPRVSLITHNQGNPDIQMQGRVTLVGNAHQMDRPPVARYLRHFPEAADLLNLDFSFYRIEPIAIRYIGGVGRVHWLTMEKYLIPGSRSFAQQEAAILTHINTQQQTTLRYLLNQQHGIDASDATAISADCDGIDTRSGDRLWRMNFSAPLTDPLLLESLSTLQYTAA